MGESCCRDHNDASGTRSRDDHDCGNHVTNRSISSIRCRWPMRTRFGSACRALVSGLAVSPAELAARATWPSLRERDHLSTCKSVCLVVIRGRANGGASHKRARFVRCRVRCDSWHVHTMPSERAIG